MINKCILKNWGWFYFFILFMLVGNFVQANFFFGIFVLYCIIDQKYADEEKKNDIEYEAEMKIINKKWADRGIDFSKIRSGK